MKNTLIILILLIAKFSISQEINNDDLIKYPLKSTISFCQKDTSKIISKKVIIYNEANRIERSSSFNDNIENYRVIYNYNEQGLLISKDFYNLLPDLKLSRTRIFKYNEKNELISEGFDDNKGNNTKIFYTYNAKGLLIKRKTECNYNSSEYSYEYNSKNLLIKTLKNNSLEYTYEYHNNLLIEQTNLNREIITTFEYGVNGKLLIKKENNQIVQRNIYSNDNLIKSWTYYFGIDPCYDRCCGQYLIKYDYYE